MPPRKKRLEEKTYNHTNETGNAMQGLKERASCTKTSFQKAVAEVLTCMRIWVCLSRKDW